MTRNFPQTPTNLRSTYQMKIKLIIWDLDNTLWKGILDEGEVVPDWERVKMIREFNDRGILNSVCSKNDIEKARSKLREVSILDEIIFPSISWQPKGPMVKSIIDAFQLRAENVLFVDDEKSNLNEVAFYNPKINALDSEDDQADAVLRSILEENSRDGRSRFGQYKNLEKKNVVRIEYGDDKLFLRESEITIWMDHRCDLHLGRIEELINRTNQLNFTKKRLNIDELEKLLNGDNENFVIFARDKFGDYGLIGFVSLRKEGHELEHFVFSCRVLNMGVEQYIYEKLGCPSVNIVGEVSTKLAKEGHVDWVRETNLANSGTAQMNDKLSPVLMAGGCDLYQMHHLLKSKARIDTYFNYPSRRYGIELHRDSIIYLYGTRYYSQRQQETIIENFPFVEPDFFKFPVLDNYDLIIYSPLIDYLQNLYAYREDPDIVISWGDFTNPTGNIYDEKEFLESIGLNDHEITNLSSKWIPLGPIDAENFLNKLRAVFEGYSGKLILIGGASKYAATDQKKYLVQHQRLNEALLAFQENRPNTDYINVDEFLTGTIDFTSSVRHYQKVVYLRLAQHIIENNHGFHKKRSLEVAVGRMMERLSHVVGRMGVKLPFQL
jgi:FkbH-like protein